MFQGVSKNLCQHSFNRVSCCSLGPLFVQIFASIIMFSCSCYYHLFLCESEQRGKLLRCFDFVGICIMICGGTTPPFYYGFMCEETVFWSRLYIGTTWTICIIAGFLTLYYRDDPTKKLLNAIAYIVAGYSVTPGLIHVTYYTNDSLVR